MRTYIINGERIENASTCKEAQRQAGERGISVRHVRVLDDHTDGELADVIARMAVIADDPEPSRDELEFFAANAAGAQRAKHEGAKGLCLSAEQRAAVQAAMRGLGVNESVFTRPPASSPATPRLKIPAKEPDAAPPAVSSIARATARAAEANADAAKGDDHDDKADGA